MMVSFFCLELAACCCWCCGCCGSLGLSFDSLSVRHHEFLGFPQLLLFLKSVSASESCTCCCCCCCCFRFDIGENWTICINLLFLVLDCCCCCCGGERFVLVDFAFTFTFSYEWSSLHRTVKQFSCSMSLPSFLLHSKKLHLFVIVWLCRRRVWLKRCFFFL